MEVKIEKLDNFGRGITYINNKICFVENALIDEIVEIEIIKENKKVIEAKTTKIIKESDSRIKSICPYNDICGGCNFNHLKYEEEIKFKTNKLKDLISKFTNIDKELVTDTTSLQENNYRNKITLHGKNNKLGLYKSSTNEIIEIDKCLLVNNKINKIISILKDINKNIEEVVIKTSNNEEEVLVDIKGEVKDLKPLKEEVKVIYLNNNLQTKEDKILTNIGKYKYYESKDSFFQINKELTEKLYDEALKVVKEKRPNKLLDLYCGTGTIGIYVSNYANEIVGIDYNKSNIEDANKNKELNNLDNISFICDKVENKIDSFKDIDMIIVDPPRAGLDLKTKEYLKIINPKDIVYISCDPVTLARDLNDLETNYNIKTIKPYNMFPRTHHVECVSVLCRKDSE